MRNAQLWNVQGGGQSSLSWSVCYLDLRDLASGKKSAETFVTDPRIHGSTPLADSKKTR